MWVSDENGLGFDFSSKVNSFFFQHIQPTQTYGLTQLPKLLGLLLSRLTLQLEGTYFVYYKQMSERKVPTHQNCEYWKI